MTIDEYQKKHKAYLNTWHGWAASTFWWPIYRLAHDIWDWKYQLRRVKWRWQRSKKGYADEDLWGIGSVLLDLMERSLTEFRNIERMGVNSQYIRKADQKLPWEKQLELGSAREKADLDYIISRLQIHREVNEEYEMDKHGGGDWEKAHQVADKALQEALVKFGRIATGLWD